MNNQQINEAAQAHAKDILGAEQYGTLPDVVQSIAADFEAGVKWCLDQNKPAKSEPE